VLFIKARGAPHARKYTYYRIISPSMYALATCVDRWHVSVFGNNLRFKARIWRSGLRKTSVCQVWFLIVSKIAKYTMKRLVNEFDFLLSRRTTQGHTPIPARVRTCKSASWDCVHRQCKSIYFMESNLVHVREWAFYLRDRSRWRRSRLVTSCFTTICLRQKHWTHNTNCI